MLKKRVTACLVVKDGIVCQSIGFNTFLPVGKPSIAVEFLNHWGIDEIILVDISASKESKSPDSRVIKELSSKCLVPLTVGGGIRTLEHIHELMQSGADKIVLNHYAIENPSFIEQASNIYGDQCIVVSIDVQGTFETGYKVFSHVENKGLDMDVLSWAKEAEQRGAGELFVTSVDRDGSYRGFDCALIEMIANEVKIPVIASGGAGNPVHFEEVFSKTSAMAASAANFFHFSEHSVNRTKAHLYKKGFPIRLDTHADYVDNTEDESFRLTKLPDESLEKLLFVRIQKEVI